MARIPFPRVKEAREVLREQALELVQLQIQLIKEAAAAGDYETATNRNQWLIEHAPAEDGVRIIDSSAAKPKEIEGPKGPQINIGIALGGMTKPKELPPVIDVKPINEHSEPQDTDSN